MTDNFPGLDEEEGSSSKGTVNISLVKTRSCAKKPHLTIGDTLTQNNMDFDGKVDKHWWRSAAAKICICCAAQQMMLEMVRD